ncbi:DUF4190 domain-containing protein [Herbiconiux sp. UC225_62]|uniref:DUF4190 domain-containing protein n=1 Tax=Herbiconiux sp. UC225_62 TaxID=3350168 RepID=UPI0036D351E1
MTNLPPGSGPNDHSDDSDENGGAVPPVPPLPEQPPAPPVVPPAPAPDATPTVAYPPTPPVPPVAPPPASAPGADAPPPYQAPPAYVPPPAYASVPPGQVPPGQVPPGQVPPGPYGQPGQYGGPPPVAPTSGGNGLGIASIIVGGVAFIGAFIPFLNYAVWFVALVGLVLGIIALVRKGRSKGLAIGGTILSGVALILSIVLAVVYTFGFIGAVNEAIDEGLATITPIPVDPLPSDDPFATDAPDDGTDDGDLGEVIAAQFGQVVTYDDGMEISVSEPTPFTPSANAVGTDQATNLQFTITIVNGTAADYQPFSFSTVTSGGVAASLIIDPDNGIEGLPPVDTIPAGQTVTYVEAYSVADANDIVYDVAPGFEYTTARFTN